MTAPGRKSSDRTVPKAEEIISAGMRSAVQAHVRKNFNHAIKKFMKKILFALSLTMASHAYATEIQLFSNNRNPAFEANRKFIEQVHERFEFDSTMLYFFIQRTKGEILNSLVAESACVDKLGGTAALAIELLDSKKHDEQLKTFFISSDGPREAREFSGIMLGALNEKERADLLSLPANSTMVNNLVGSYSTSLMMGTHESAFKRVATFFFAAHCPR
jgi:hypothetical protein